MAAAAAPGGLARRVFNVNIPPAAELPVVEAAPASSVDDHGGLVLAPVMRSPIDRLDHAGSNTVGSAAAVIGNVDGVAAPAAGGWSLSGGGDGGGGDREDNDDRYRYFGMSFRDEWISASSSRIEKLNSRAPWKNSWTEEVRIGRGWTDGRAL